MYSRRGKTVQLQPLRMQPDYGTMSQDVNPFLNTAPTELNRDIEKEKDSKKRQQMQDALNSWRITVPGPFWKSAVANELLKVAKLLME